MVKCTNIHCVQQTPPVDKQLRPKPGATKPFLTRKSTMAQWQKSFHYEFDKTTSHCSINLWIHTPHEKIYVFTENCWPNFQLKAKRPTFAIFSHFITFPLAPHEQAIIASQRNSNTSLSWLFTHLASNSTASLWKLLDDGAISICTHSSPDWCLLFPTPSSLHLCPSILTKCFLSNFQSSRPKNGTWKLLLRIATSSLPRTKWRTPDAFIQHHTHSPPERPNLGVFFVFSFRHTTNALHAD